MFFLLGIIGAMDSEVSELKKEMTIHKVTTIAGMDFCKGLIYDKDVVVVKCGVGKVNAAVCAQILVDRFHVNAVINTGVAGALNSDIDICDIVISKDALEHDLDVTPLGYERGIIPDMDTSVFSGDESLIKLAADSAKEAEVGVKVFIGRVVSGDQFIAGKEKKDDLEKQFLGDCAEMEGASIAHVAHLNQIPCLIIRSISDKADGSADMDYPTFEKMAAKNSADILKTMIKKYELI